MSDKKNEEPTAEDTARAAAILWDLVLLCMGSYTIKIIWNTSIKRMFPSMPYVYFLDGVGILILVYIIARAASMGFMTESMRMISRSLESASEFLKGVFEGLGMKVNVRSEEKRSDDNSDLN